MAPNDHSTIEDVVADIIQWHRGDELLVIRNFNTNLAAPEGQAWDEQIAAVMA